jgi:hypothetical protein
MAEWTDDAIERHVAARLDAVGLTGPAFDRAAICADLRERFALDAELDDLLGPATHDDDPERSDADPAPFDPLRP